MVEVFALTALALYFGWRYSKTSVDPDWAFFNLYAFTGAMYGRDFVDCKTPGVHIFFWLLSKVVGKDVPRIKFASHFLLGIVGVPVYFLTGSVWAALAYEVLVNSGWLVSFHGNVGNVPAALLVIALLTPWYVAVPLWLLAVFYEPKLLPSFAVYALIQHWFWLGILIPFGIVGVFAFRNQQWFQWLWEGSVTIPARMAKWRRTAVQALKITAMPWMTAAVTMYLGPWLLLGMFNKPDIWYWLPVVVYIAFLCTGTTIRQNHLIPIIPWIALSVSPMMALGLSLVDLVSAGFYTGDLWRRFYAALANMNDEAKLTGEALRDRSGTLYVNGIHSGIYLYSRKPPTMGMTEQIEIRDVAHERRQELYRRWKENPPDWVVVGDAGALAFRPVGYIEAGRGGINRIFRKTNGNP